MNLTTRRAFMRGTAGTLVFGSHVPQIFAACQEPTSKPASASESVFVMITLAGGNDGLNTIIPYADDLYYKLRPGLAIKRPDVRKLNDVAGLHPAMKNIEAAFHEGRLAIISNVGYPQPNRSHFHSMDVWQTGDPELKNTRTGWLGRAVDASPGSRECSLFAFHMGDEVPRALLAESQRVTAMNSIQDYSIAPDRFAQNDRRRVERAWAAMSAGTDPVQPSLATARRTIAQALASASELKDILSKSTSSVSYPGSGLAQNLKLAAQVIGGGIPARIISITIGGFDTHANQKNSHAQLWQQIDEAIAAFHKDLSGRGRAGDVVVMLYSEFGRRVAENGSAGTDHGAAGPVLLFGDPVRGGLHGGPPLLAELEDGDLKYSVDFRRVYSSVLGNWLRINSPIGSEGRFEPLPVFKSA